MAVPQNPAGVQMIDDALEIFFQYRPRMFQNLFTAASLAKHSRGEAVGGFLRLR